MKKPEVNRTAGNEQPCLKISSESGGWDFWVVSLQVPENASLREETTWRCTGQSQSDTEVEMYSPQHMASLGNSVHVLLYLVAVVKLPAL